METLPAMEEMGRKGDGDETGEKGDGEKPILPVLSQLTLILPTSF